MTTEQIKLQIEKGSLSWASEEIAIVLENTSDCYFRIAYINKQYKKRILSRNFDKWQFIKLIENQIEDALRNELDILYHYNIKTVSRCERFAAAALIFNRIDPDNLYTE